jgi:hypothetical protein
MKNFEQLYNNSIEYDADYSDGLTNHLPMALLSLQSLDSSLEHMNLFFGKYSKKLSKSKIDSANRINGKNWEIYLGNSTYLGDYLSFFESEISQLKFSEVIEKYLSTLAKSPLSAAFHCVIRVSYVLKFKKINDLAHALAYWAVNFIEIPSIEKEESTIDLKMLNMEYMKSYKEAHGMPQGNIGDRALFAMGTPEFKNLFGQLGAGDSTSAAEQFSLQVMCETLDFTALHLITGTHAIKEILSQLPSESKSEIERTVMPSLVATFLSMTKASKHNLTLDIETTIEEIRSIGANSLNDHVIKFCYVALDEFKKSGNVLYLQLAKQYSVL